MCSQNQNSTLSFLHAQGTRIENKYGEEILLRGVNLGNWFLPEGYMWKFPHELSSHRKMEEKFTSILGAEKSAHFWESYYDRYIQEADIQRIAMEGYNSVRLPLNHRLFLSEDGTWIEPMMQRIDALLDYCEAHGIYVILDLHAAPGGQTGTHIDDSEGSPSLLTDSSNVEQTLLFWKGMAQRYRNRAVVAGYDLLNEPLPREHQKYTPQLLDVYRQIIKEIRKVDTRHIVILECSHWGTDFRIFTEKLDENMVIEFHKYWCPTDYRYVRDFLNIRETLNVPLWMGESGENTLDWFVASFQMLEDYNISWCFWPWKKMQALNSPCSVGMPGNWDKFIACCKGEFELKAPEAESILNEYLENILFENCDYQSRVVQAMMRRVPFRIPAEAYGLKGVGRSYYFTDHVVTSLNLRREEGANLKFIVPRDTELPEYIHAGCLHQREEHAVSLTLQAGDWVKYEVNALEDAKLPFSARLCGRESCSALEFWLDDVVLLAKDVDVEMSWNEKLLSDEVEIPEGRHELKVVLTQGSIHLDWFQFGELLV